jgi:hypothetical protein
MKGDFVELQDRWPGKRCRNCVSLRFIWPSEHEARTVDYLTKILAGEIKVELIARDIGRREARIAQPVALGILEFKAGQHIRSEVVTVDADNFVRWHLDRPCTV